MLKFLTIRYRLGRITQDELQAFVDAGRITEDEYKTIVGGDAK